MGELSRAEKEKLLAELQALDEEHRFNRIRFFKPYPKQEEFFADGLFCIERMLQAGNQQGKSEAGAAETSYHLTGLYPSDWRGRRFDHPVRAWAAGETGTLVRDVQQSKLCGLPGVEDAWGTGLIPKACLLDKSLARGVTDAYDTIQVQHHDALGRPDGISTLTFKSYEQGRPKFQGEPVDFIWADEECPMDVYMEMLARTTATKGMVFTTFTPLKGRTDLIIHFEEDNPRRRVTRMTMYDAQHLTDADRAELLERYPKHQRDARLLGIPILGSGRIYEFPDDRVAEDPLEYIPAHWTKLWAIDFGIDHPFAALLGLWDKDNDCIHIHHAIRMKDGTPLEHAAAMKPIGAMVPVAYPHDGDNREKGTGETLASAYRKHNLKLLGQNAAWEDGSISVERGIYEIAERIKTNRLKVARHLGIWFEEFREYHRKDGLIVKVRDDLMDATRILCMAKRYGKTVPLGGKTTSGNPKFQIADGVEDWNPWG
jgi:phage terminase large subunit-like protein